MQQHELLHLSVFARSLLYLGRKHCLCCIPSQGPLQDVLRAIVRLVARALLLGWLA